MKLNKQILSLAVPNIISNLSVPLLSSVDTALVGHLPQSYFIGAVALGSMIFNFIYWGFGFLRMGTTGLTAQAYGRKNKKEMHLVFARAMLVAAASGIILIFLSQPMAKISFLLIDATAEVEQFAEGYFKIRIFAAPATLIHYVLLGWFFGNQNAKYPLILVVSANLLNIFFDALLVLHFNMNADGVALGTVGAQYLSLVLGFFLLRKFSPDVFKLLDIKRVLDWPELKRFFAVNGDIFIRTLSLVFAFSFFTAKSAEFGDTILAANAILLNLWMIISYGIDGFAYAAESLVGKYFGAHDLSGLKKMIRRLFVWGIGLGAAFSLIFLIFDKPLLNLFSSQPQVIETALVFMVWTYPAPVVNSFCYIWDGIYIGATASVEMRNTMLLAVIIFFPVFYIARYFMGNHGIWLAFTLFMILRGLTMTVTANKALYKKIT